MQPRPLFDRSLLIPVVISIVSILGICLIFLTTGLGGRVPPPTATPSSLIFPETRTLTPSPSTTPTRDKTAPPTVTLIQEETPPTATGSSPDAYPGPPAEILPSTGTLVTESLPTTSDTPTPVGIQPLRVGKYDDTDPNIVYDPYWTALKNPATVNAYKGTLHASTDAGSEASFRFTGDQFHLGYQRGKSFGTVTVFIDDQPHGFHEQAFDLVWRSPELSPGDHFVRIVHESGETINLDYIVILD